MVELKLTWRTHTFHYVRDYMIYFTKLRFFRFTFKVKVPPPQYIFASAAFNVSLIFIYKVIDSIHSPC